MLKYLIEKKIVYIHIYIGMYIGGPKSIPG